MANVSSLVDVFLPRNMGIAIALYYMLSGSDHCGGVHRVVTGGVVKGCTNWWYNEVGLHTAAHGTLKGYTPLWLLQMGCWTLKPLSAASPQFYTNAACTVLPTSQHVHNHYHSASRMSFFRLGFILDNKVFCDVTDVLW
jgi:hypothetical protein